MRSDVAMVVGLVLGIDWAVQVVSSASANIYTLQNKDNLQSDNGTIKNDFPGFCQVVIFFSQLLSLFVLHMSLTPIWLDWRCAM